MLPATPSVTLDEMKRHALDLCERNDITVQWYPRKAWSGGPADPAIRTPPIKSTITYAVAMHEIGHVLGRHQTSWSVMVRERWAWQWAKRNALRWTPGMERCMQRSLAWYAARKWPRECPICGEASAPCACQAARAELHNAK